jgi:hypothetical protein
MARNYFFIGSIIIVLLLLAQAPELHGQPLWVVANKTVPSRTPTPLPVTPTEVPTNPPTTNPPPGNPPPTATQPSTTMTATAISLPPTPGGGIPVTAVPCSTQPTIQPINQVNPTNVRQGPGTDYAIIGQLVVNEVRPIIGRAANAPWWLIQLNSGQSGWVADEVVLVQGNTINIPISSVPPLNGVTPTPGIPWQPTAPPVCPTMTATAVSQATAQTVIISPLETSTGAASYPADTATETGETAVQDTAVTPTPTAITLPTSIAAAPQPTLAATAVTTDNTANNNSPDFSAFLLVGAALLVVAGTAVFIAKRRP